MSDPKKCENGQNDELVYWRSFENRQRTQEYIESIQNEFATDWEDLTTLDRRSVLKVMGASMALAGLGNVACRQPEEKILPYNKPPEDVIPGIPNFFSTAMPSPDGAVGLRVESHEGRPTKIEGNKEHPQSLGSTGFLEQASVLGLYDPDRSKSVMTFRQGTRFPVLWAELDEFMNDHFLEVAQTGGSGLAFLTGLELSPSFLRLKNGVNQRFPKARWYVHEPLRHVNTERGVELLFGKHKRIRYHLDQARVICSVFSDPLMDGPERLRHARDFSKGRKVHSAKEASTMNRLYAVEAHFSVTGSNADHRMRLPAGLSAEFVKALAFELANKHHVDVPETMSGRVSLRALASKKPENAEIDPQFVAVLAQDLFENRGRAVLVPGEHLEPAVVSAIHLINLALNAQERCLSSVSIDDPDLVALLESPDLEALSESLEKGDVKTLVIIGSNPCATASRKANFQEALKKAPATIHMDLYENETGRECLWHVPMTHYLEAFGDTLAYDGLASIVQPLIAPLHQARSPLELLSQIASGKPEKPYEIVKETWMTNKRVIKTDAEFRKAIHDGLIAQTGFTKNPIQSLRGPGVVTAFSAMKPIVPHKNSLELILRNGYCVADGRYGNCSWLQELPDPITKIDWGNALLVSPVFANALKIQSGQRKMAYTADVVELTHGSIKLKLPVYVMPGLPDFSTVVSLGYGRTAAGDVGNGVGVDVMSLLSSPGKWVVSGITLAKTGEVQDLSTTQEQFAMNADVVQEQTVLSMMNRSPTRAAPISVYKKDPTYARTSSAEALPENLQVLDANGKLKPLQITNPWSYDKGNQWGMAIDLTKCIGCNACVMACQSENNIPVVGKEQVMRGRMFRWIRVDRYFTGPVSTPKAVHQPVPCMHCENAPCENVCPVAATAHDTEGLNVMAYNRCIGTRYCANNCPYKVRSFNYFDFTHTGNLYVNPKYKKREITLKLQRNPDVTVRYRGVMEKCTYCTQRIQEKKMEYRREGKDPNYLADGSVVPACKQVCPTEAIEFGNIIDPESQVSKWKRVDRNYVMLGVLATRPRTSYLAKLRNPHPGLVS